MRRAFLWAVAALAPASAVAQVDEVPRLAEPDPPFLQELLVEDDDLGQDCAGLLRRIDELRGQPQRRYWLQQRYDADCRRGQAPQEPVRPR